VRDAKECLAKADEMEREAEASPPALAVVYFKLAVDWQLMARLAVWNSKLQLPPHVLN
jgi:hypothetical protein